MENKTPKRILIVGGGFAGLTVAMELERKLARDPSVEITLINRENFFLLVFRDSAYPSTFRRTTSSPASAKPPGTISLLSSWSFYVRSYSDAAKLYGQSLPLLSTRTGT